ncbi:MAG: S53 family peptidase, partial [Gemmatimonadetes bacterium]|nr:S53 family peptidase [Gemmatimonadota bacterium]
EVALDIEVAGGVAPGATIVVYFTPDTSDRSFLDAVSTAVHDQVHHPDVISISWGGPENAWSAQAMQAMDEIFQAATAIGVPVFVAAGDDGASDGEKHGLHADFPASAPHAIACGGTRLAAPKQVRTSEVVWNELATGHGATGGGFSAFFPAPAWQKPVLGTHTMRGVPDLAADADPFTGYRVRVRHRDGVIGGTSAVAPLMAGLVALCNQKAGHNPGALIQKLYALGSPSKAFFDVVKGNNAGFSAAKGWDACTGLGVPVGEVFAEQGWAQKVPALALKGADGVAQPA